MYWYGSCLAGSYKPAAFALDLFDIATHPETKGFFYDSEVVESQKTEQATEQRH